jgi:hypothetical protein
LDRFKFIEGKKVKDLEKIDWSKYVAPGSGGEEDEDMNENLKN